MEANETRLEAQDLNAQGAMLLKTGKLDEARQKFDQAIELDPMLMESYKNYGDLQMALEKYQDAKNYYKKAMLIEKSGQLYFLYGNACFMNDEPHEGLENYNMAIEEGYDSADMMYFMGMAYEYMQDDNMALRYYTKACVKNPVRADFAVKKINMQIKLDMMDHAWESTEELLLTSPEMYDGYHIKTLLLMRENRLDEAVEFSKKASEKFPEDVSLLYDYARTLAHADRLDEALKVVEQAKSMKYFSEEKRNLTLLEAQIYAQKNDSERALACCAECLMLEGENGFDGEVRFMVMNLHLARKDFEKALEEAERILRKEAKDLYYFAALYYKPFCLKQLGKDDEAKKHFRTANSLYRLETLKNPASVDIYLYRAMCLRDLEEYDKAMEMLDFILGLTTDIAEVYVIRADIYNIQGRKALAEEELKKAYVLKPELKPDTESAGD